MSTVVDTYREDIDVSHAVDFGRDREPTQKRSRHPQYRRQKRWTWGNGRGARMLNLRAFAGCLAVALASLSASAAPLPVTIDYATVGNPGNTANTNGWGSVSDIFKISKYETTNAQYVEFLNKVDAGGTNPNGVYNLSMGTNNKVGGISFNPGAASGSKYFLKSGGPVEAPVGTSYAQMPVLFTNWFSAARFVNWLVNGQQSIASTMETGSYTLNNQVLGVIPARNPGASVFLPSRDEWYKAGFYDGSGSYTLYPTSVGTLPTNTVTELTRANAANYGGVATPTETPLNIGSYTNTASFYGVYDLFGNATELTDTAGTGSDADKVQLFSGSYGTTFVETTWWASDSAGVFRPSLNATANIGFRVAAVPEPSTIVLVGAGFASLAGYEWSRRRKAKASQIAA